MSRIYIGIDPGLSGAVAVLVPGQKPILLDVPTRKATKGEVYLPGAMVDLLRPYADGALVAIEDVSAPRTGGQVNGNVSSALKIGMGRGLWEGILAGLGIAYESAAPSTWKKQFRLIGEDKKASRARACELFPAIREELAKKRPDFSEALLLAEYARRRDAGCDQARQGSAKEVAGC